MATGLDPARVRGYYDTHADDYDRQFGGVERRLLGDQRRWATSRARGTVLELGVGTGLNLPLYPDDVVRIVGVDLSEEMLARARARVSAAGLGGRVELRRGDAHAVDLPDGSVDTVVSTYSLCTVADPAAVLREARRVLAPGGRLVLVEHGPARGRVLRGVQRLLNPLAVRWQADDLLREPRVLAAAAGFAVTGADQAGFGGVVHRVAAHRPAG
ncbi:class I SAM-dependent methyltransferase [Geodermatophilus sp. URMC 64]